MSKAIIPFNETPIVPIRLKEGSRYAVVDTYTINRIPQPIPGGSFKCNVLDKEGGSIIGIFAVNYVTDGTDGKFQEVFEIAELQALLDAYDAGTGPLPGYYELFFSDDTTEERFRIWWEGPILISRSGS